MKEYKSVGIIAEYNPFHNGHQYHLSKSLRETGAEVSIAVMSGSLTQRGQFPVADKWTRAELAVQCGIDLVVEMPVIFSCNSAGYFAASGVEILESLGADFIAFGSETGDAEALRRLVRLMSDYEKDIEEMVREAVKQGWTYPRARQEVLRRLGGDQAADLLKTPNNILAVEYLRHMKHAKAVAIRREGPGYHEEGAMENIASASYIRKILGEGGSAEAWLPSCVTDKLIDEKKITEDRMFRMVVQSCLTMTADQLEELAAAGEGLGNKIKDSLRYTGNYEDLVEQLKSKRYTRSRIYRLLGQAMVGITGEMVRKGKNYIRVLAFSEAGSRYLKTIKKSGQCWLPIITNINKELGAYPGIRPVIEKDILAADLYNLAAQRDLYRHSDFVEKVRAVIR